MTLTLEERDTIARRLAEIRTERETLPEKPRDDQAQRVVQLNRERTDLVRTLADELTPQHREVMMQRLTEIAAELVVIGRAADAQGIAVPPRYEQLHHERCELELKLWNRVEIERIEQKDSRSHLACPNCKSTDLDFKGLRNNAESSDNPMTNPDAKVVSGTYSWQCKKCKHQFVVTIPTQSG